MVCFMEQHYSSVQQYEQDVRDMEINMKLRWKKLKIQMWGQVDTYTYTEYRKVYGIDKRM